MPSLKPVYHVCGLVDMMSYVFLRISLTFQKSLRQVQRQLGEWSKVGELELENVVPQVGKKGSN